MGYATKRLRQRKQVSSLQETTGRRDNLSVLSLDNVVHLKWPPLTPKVRHRSYPFITIKDFQLKDKFLGV